MWNCTYSYLKLSMNFNYKISTQNWDKLNETSLSDFWDFRWKFPSDFPEPLKKFLQFVPHPKIPEAHTSQRENPSNEKHNLSEIRWRKFHAVRATSAIDFSLNRQKKKLCNLTSLFSWWWIFSLVPRYFN